MPTIQSTDSEFITSLDDGSHSSQFAVGAFDLDRLKRLIADHSLTRGRSNGGALDIESAEVHKRQRIEVVQSFVLEGLPMSFPFTSDKIYVRECYHVYYDLILQCLADDKIWFISITGTPGIGKSVFYLYFFEKYRAENSDTIIILASFDKDRKLKECKEYPPGNGAPITHAQIPRVDGDVVYLYDGPPSAAPAGRKMVCFTSPNYTWLYNNDRDESHALLYFPLWSWHELKEANALLGLNISLSDLTDRFEMFGGSARYCLAKDKKLVRRGSDGLLAKILSVDSFDTLGMCMRSETPDDKLSHQIFHSIPEIDDEFPFVDFEQRVICSKKAQALILARIREKSDANRSDLLSSIKGISKFAQFRGSVFEDYAHGVLGNGGVFNVESLDGKLANFQLALPCARYRPSKVGQESVDGVCTIDNIVYLFQITIASSHQVTTHGMLEQLRLIKKWEDYREGNIEVRLVFVITQSNEKFPKQRIKTEKKISWDSPISEMSHMKEAWRDELYITHRDLSARDLLRIAKSDQKAAARYGRALADFKSRIDNLSSGQHIKDVPQFRILLRNFEENEIPRPQSKTPLHNQIHDLSQRVRNLEQHLRQNMQTNDDDLVGG